MTTRSPFTINLLLVDGIAEGMKLIGKKILTQIDQNHYVFTQDYLFGSPSTAAGVAQGRSANGRLDWRDAKGKSIKDREDLP